MKTKIVERDPVMLYNSRMHLFPGKLRSRWSSPFSVTEVLGSGVVEVKNHKSERYKANRQRLKNYYGKLPDIQVVHVMNISDA